MRITASMLRRIIAEEISKSKRQSLREGTAERPIHATPQLINRIIKEELELHRRQKRLAKARRLKSLRERRLAEARRRRRAENVYYY